MSKNPYVNNPNASGAAAAEETKKWHEYTIKETIEGLNNVIAQTQEDVKFRGLSGLVRDFIGEHGAPINATQFVTDILGGEGGITEKSLSREDIDALYNIITDRNLSNKISYNDYNTQGASHIKDSDIATKLSNPYDRMKTLLGQASVKEVEGGYLITDQFNYNYFDEDKATGAGTYNYLRHNVAEKFGSREGEGSKVKIFIPYRKG